MCQMEFPNIFPSGTFFLPAGKNPSFPAQKFARKAEEIYILRCNLENICYNRTRFRCEAAGLCYNGVFLEEKFIHE